MAKFKLETTVRFKKEAKLCKRRGLPMDELWIVVGKLLDGETLDDKYRVHNLTGNYQGCKECHIKPDWLLIWKEINDTLTLLLTNTGTHSDLFGKSRK